MSEKKNRGGRPAKTGGHTLIHRADKLAAYPHVRRYLDESRRGLIADLGGEANLSTAKMILIDRVISKLAIVRLIEEKVAESGVFIPGTAALVNALGASYLAYSNSIRLSLVALGLKRISAGLNWDEMIKARYAKKPDRKPEGEKIVSPEPSCEGGKDETGAGSGER